MEENNLLTEVNLWPIERRQMKYKAIDSSSAVKISAKIISNGHRLGTNFLLTIEDQQVFTAHDFGQFGRIYRCRDRLNCNARLVLTPHGEVFRLKNAKLHSHVSNSEQFVTDSNALCDIKEKCTDLKLLAGGRRVTKVSDIVNDVLQG